MLDVTRYDNNNKDGAIPGTVDAYHQIAEVTSMTSDASRYDNNNKDGAIPGTVEVYDQIAEVVSDAARYDNNNKDGAIPGTVEVYEKIAEVDRSLGEYPYPVITRAICFHPIDLSISEPSRAPRRVPQVMILRIAWCIGACRFHRPHRPQRSGANRALIDCSIRKPKSTRRSRSHSLARREPVSFGSHTTSMRILSQRWLPRPTRCHFCQPGQQSGQ